MAKRETSKRSEKQVFTQVKISATAEVGKVCGLRALILYQTILAIQYIKRTPEYTLPTNLVAAMDMCKQDVSAATKKLEEAGYIEVHRQPGHKNIFKLTPKGERGLVSSRLAAMKT